MAGCSVEVLVNGMVNTYKNSPRLVGWANATGPILDVTDIVRQVMADVQQAYLTIYGDPSKVRVIYKSLERPPDNTTDQIVQNWLNGIEIERQKCEADGLHYLVMYPAKLTVNGQPGTDTTMWKILGVSAAVLLAMDFIGKKE